MSVLNFVDSSIKIDKRQIELREYSSKYTIHFNWQELGTIQMI